MDCRDVGVSAQLVWGSPPGEGASSWPPGRFRCSWMVQLSITRRSGWHAWTPVSGDFERRLATLASKTISKPHIDAESRRGRDYVRVTLAMTVAAADVAQALAGAWRTF